jgi:hypothetical protein
MMRISASHSEAEMRIAVGYDARPMAARESHAA